MELLINASREEVQQLSAACNAADVALHKGRAEWYSAAAALGQMDEGTKITENDTALLREASEHLERALMHFKKARQYIAKMHDLARPIKDSKAFMQSMDEAAKLHDTLITNIAAQLEEVAHPEFAGDPKIVAELSTAFAKLGERGAQNAKRKVKK